MVRHQEGSVAAAGWPGSLQRGYSPKLLQSLNQGGLMARRKVAVAVRLAVLAALAGVITLTGCSSSMKYTYDPGVNFSGAKTYQWAARPLLYGSTQDDLLEANVRFDADRVLEAKGWKKVSDQAELVFSTDGNYKYEAVAGVSGSHWVLTHLELRAARRDDGKAVWRGAASGEIDTSASSSDLKEAVSRILSTFPPK